MTEEFSILVVDDNAGNRFTARELLSRFLNVRILEAASGEEALLLTIENEFQLILLDIQMPGMDGYETARLLQMTERTRGIPIIFLTAVYKTEEFIKRGYAVGAVDYLTKPLDDNMLMNRVRHYQYLFERERKLTVTLDTLRSTQENLVQSEKLSALGSMVAGVSHELNTPLGNVKLATSALRERIDEITRRDGRNDLSRAQVRDFLRDGRELIDLANHSIERAIDLVTHFKQVAVDQTSERRRQFDLLSVINGTIATLRPSFKKEPWVINVDVPDNIQMDSYPGPLEQIVINLVLNSIRHGFDGRDAGSITIQGACDVGARNFSGTVVLKFIDDGVGIPAHHLDRVFDPFFTTKLGKGGSGIGLNITHRIATTLLGGSIKVESRFGSGSTGSTFTLSMPLRAPSAI